MNLVFLKDLISFYRIAAWIVCGEDKTLLLLFEKLQFNWSIKRMAMQEELFVPQIIKIGSLNKFKKMVMQKNIKFKPQR